MTESQRLLAEYAHSSSEAAFREIVTRYLDLTYSTAIRLVDGDAYLAQDVTQLVFIDLARMARTLSREVMLGGWLHRHCCFVARKVMRGERRRAARERQAIEMNALRDDSQISQSEIAPVLDDAIDQLNTQDRAVIVLRFFEQRDFRSVGEVLGIPENTVRMRITRALEKLGKLLKREGIACSAAALGTALATGAVASAPVGMAVAITGAAIAGAATGTATTLTILKLMSLTKLQLGVAALVMAGAATTILIQHQSQLKLREQSEYLQKQIAQLQADNKNLASRVTQLKRVPAPRLPAPTIPTTASTAAPLENLQFTNLYARFKDKQPKLTAEQFEPYLQANRRNAASLLAAYRTTGDAALLAEAMGQYPNDPQVAFEAVFKKDVSPEERRQWLEALKKADTGNSLPNYLLALDYFKSGQIDQAVQELVAVSGKQQFQDYTLDRMQDDEEAYLAAGYSVAEARTIPVSLPQLRQVKDLGLSLVDLAKSYRLSGDEASAQAALQMAVNLGQRYKDTPGETEVSWLTGMAVERIALSAMDPSGPYGSDGQTVQDRLNQLNQKKAELKELKAQLEPLLPNLSDQDWISYTDRWRVFGEESAIRWVVNKYGQK
ncbi:MAG: hypothetical protein DME22_12620 [Verrucomicrobia bacterium]|nr:MAG: hypothetical protein DME22_12620 [Verrucomicrobiota bacterium]